MLFLPDEGKKSEGTLKVLFVTTQWPTQKYPNRAPFVKREVDILRESGLSVDVMIFEGGFHPLRYAQAAYHINSHIKTLRYDIIHARFGQSGLVAIWQNKIPVIVTYGGSDIEYSPDLGLLKHWVMAFVGRYVARAASGVIVVSNHLGKLLHVKHYYVVSSPVDLDLFRPMDKFAAREQLGLPMDKKLLLFAASNPQEKRKRYSLALQIVDEIKKTLDVELVLMTKQAPKDVPIFMNACDALLMTSSHEGSPNVVKEALSCNLPVISTDVGDVRERLAGLSACFVSSDDGVKAMAEGALQVLNTKNSFDALSLVKNLDKSIFAKRIQEIYASIIKAKREQVYRG